MKPVHKGGNARKNFGLLLLAVIGAISFLSAFIYGLQNNPLWFSRMALGSIILGLYLIADKD